MPSVAILVAGVSISGGINVIFEQALQLATLGFDVTLISREGVSLDKISWHKISQVRAADGIKWCTFSEVADKTFDIAVATYWRTFFDIWRVKAEKYVYFVQSIESRFYPRRDRVLRSTVEGTYQIPVGFITEARWIRDYLRLMHGQEASLAVNGIDKDVFTANGASVAERIDGTLRILIEGAVDAEFKNVPRTVELCRQANAGEVWLLTPSDIQGYEGVGRVFSKVPLSATAQIYRSCDVLVKLSTVEGVFGPPLEMFHCGGTAIVYDVTGHDEYIVKGKNALVIPTGRDDLVLASLRMLAEYPALVAALKKGAAATASNYPSWQVSGRAFSEGLRIAAGRSTISQATLRDQCRRLWHAYESRLREKSDADAIQKERILSIGSSGASGNARSRVANQVAAIRCLFDTQWYLDHNEDVCRAGIDPVLHYIEWGAAEGRNPHPLFDTRWYLEQSPDVSASGVNPFQHFIEFGAGEGRSPSPYFDLQWYLQSYPDVVDSGLNPIQHFMRYAEARGLNPSPNFITSWYLAQNRDVREAGINALVHYLEFGRMEGRLPNPGRG